ncbi:MAG: protein kinase, partial [Myxococcales bacterium]|nr:protein kinase [Myxococcales bacterium]
MTEGSFRLLERVAEAPHGELWRARDAGGRTVALKLGLDAGARARFAAEARVLALGLSRRMPALVDVGFVALAGKRALAVAAGGHALPFLALEWVAGQSLDTAARGAAHRAGDVETLAWQVAHDVGQALADLHALGIAHGDLKPQNLMAEGGGRVRLVDLGLACPLGAREPGGGTPRYLGLGDRSLGDARARDLLALGLVLAELALPELAARADVLAAARQAPLPEPLASVCRALLVCEPGAR